MEVEHWEVMKANIALGLGIRMMPDLCILPQDRPQLGTMPQRPGHPKSSLRLFSPFRLT
jgi:hypothetical protein